MCTQFKLSHYDFQTRPLGGRNRPDTATPVIFWRNETSRHRLRLCREGSLDDLALIGQTPVRFCRRGVFVFSRRNMAGYEGLPSATRNSSPGERAAVPRDTREGRLGHPLKTKTLPKRSMIAGQRSVMLILKSHQRVPCIQSAFECLVNDHHHYHRYATKTIAWSFGGKPPGGRAVGVDP